MCGPGELSNIVLALAYMGFVPDWAWTARWCRVAALKLPAFRSQELANSVWALGRLRRPLPGPLLTRSGEGIKAAEVPVAGAAARKICNVLDFDATYFT
eukprot:1157103-Pelagomonas_calceolata.AAC.3